MRSYSMLEPGAVVQSYTSSYRVVRKLAVGGMGVVHLAERLEDGLPVVLKEPRFDGSLDEVKLMKLRVEGQALKALNHPFIVQFIDEADYGETYYLMEQYIQGMDLSEKCWNSPMEEGKAVEVMLKVLDAVGYIHIRGGVYRDLKPDNIILQASGDPVLIDFGAAKFGYMQMELDASGKPLVRQGTVIMTPGWSAPEQLLGVAVPQSDIYAAGMLLFYMLTGKPPSDYLEPSGALLALPSDVNPDVSPEVSQVVAKATSPDPSLRYETTGDMVNALVGQQEELAGAPRVILEGRVYPLTKPVTVINRHPDQGGDPSADIWVTEAAPYYISRVAAAVIHRREDGWYLEDRNANRMAVYRRGQWVYIRGRGEPAGEIKLEDGDLIALAYSPGRGPYITMTFKET